MKYRKVQHTFALKCLFKSLQSLLVGISVKILKIKKLKNRIIKILP